MEKLRARRFFTGVVASLTLAVVSLNAYATGISSDAMSVSHAPVGIASVPVRVVNPGVPLTLLAHASTNSSRTTRPVVRVVPRDAHVNVGAIATFVARASGRPAPRVQWYQAAPASVDFHALRAATSPVLLLRHVAMGMNRVRLRAVFTNSLGHATTRTVTLFVAAPPPVSTTTSPTTTSTTTSTTTTLPAPTTTTTAASPAPLPGPVPPPSITAPVVTVNPQSVTTITGSTVTLSAAASGSPTPSVAWWYAPGAGQAFTPYPGATSSVLSFTSTTAQNGWLFEAIFTNSAGSATTSVATLVVAVANGNWAGYVTTSNTYTSAVGTFSVPQAYCPSSGTTYSSVWVGIDGYGSSSVEQDGVEMDCANGVPSYNAWYEMYGITSATPQCSCYASVPLSASSYPVAPGDVVTASVVFDTPTTQWTLSLHDATRHWNFSIAVSAASPTPAQASAEWILEQPSLCSDSLCTNITPANLTPTSPFTFTNASATATTGSGTISAFSNVAVAIASAPTIVVAPGPLSADGSSFSE